MLTIVNNCIVIKELDKTIVSKAKKRRQFHFYEFETIKTSGEPNILNESYFIRLKDNDYYTLQLNELNTKNEKDFIFWEMFLALIYYYEKEKLKLNHKNLINSKRAVFKRINSFIFAFHHLVAYFSLNEVLNKVKILLDQKDSTNLRITNDECKFIECSLILSFNKSHYQYFTPYIANIKFVVPMYTLFIGLIEDINDTKYKYNICKTTKTLRQKLGIDHWMKKDAWLTKHKKNLPYYIINYSILKSKLYKIEAEKEQYNILNNNLNLYPIMPNYEPLK